MTRAAVDRVTPDEIARIQPSYDEIADRAYELYMCRAVGEGSDLDDWIRAERELMEERLRARAPSTVKRRGVRRSIGSDLSSK